MSFWKRISLVMVIAGLTISATGVAQNGKVLYDQICASCHGAAGKGDGVAGQAMDPKPANFTNAEEMERLSDSYLKAVIKAGKHDAMKNGEKYGFTPLWMPAFSGLKDSEIDGLIAMIREIQKTKPVGDKVKQIKSQHAAAYSIYQANCERCHGPNFDGKGPDTQVKDKTGKPVLLQPLPPDFRDDLFMSRYSDGALKKIIKEGRENVQAKGQISLMTGFGAAWTDQQIADVIAYIRSLAVKKAAPAKK